MNIADIEKDVIEEIINIALMKAGDSLAFFTGERVIMNSLSYAVEKITDETSFSNKVGDNLNILYTEIRGDIGGHCFLIFNQEEVLKLAKNALPPSILEDEEKFQEMSKAILLEVDNIITASVVTQFANLLNMKMLGYIPYWEERNEEGVTELIKSKANTDQFIINFKTTYLTDKNEIEPEFVWILEQKFIEKIIQFSENKENRHHLTKLSRQLKEG